MCIGKRECQRCETCGSKKYQLWADAEMHPRGCPFGFDRMDRCPDAVNHTKMLLWARDNGVNMTTEGLAKIDQMTAAGVDLTAAPVDFAPSPKDTNHDQ